MDLTAAQWRVLVDTSVRAEAYTREMSGKARTFADQDRAARRENPLAANSLAAGRATLHGMQTELNTHLQQQVDELKATLGPDAAGRIQAYVQDPMAASVSAVPIGSMRLQAQRARKGAAQ